MIVNNSNQVMSKVVYCLPQKQIASVVKRLGECGWAIYRLEGISDPPTLFSVVKRKLPLDPPISGQVNWSALSDSLWYGLAAAPHEKHAICWLDADSLLKCNPAAYSDAAECFQDVALMLREESKLKKSTLPVLLVILFGTGTQFNDTFDLK